MAMDGDEARFWRVYKTEWTVAHCSDKDGDDGRQECLEKFRSDFEGRVREDDWRLMPWSQAQPDKWPWMLELCVPVLKGEYGSRAAAQRHATEIGGATAREGGQADRAFLGYAKRMLGEETGWMSASG